MWFILYILASAGLVTYFHPQQVAYHSIYLYSSIEMLITRLTKLLHDMFNKTNKRITNIDVYNFEAINDIQIYDFVDYKETFNNNPEMVFAKNPDCKMIIFNDNTSNVTNKICYYKPYENVSSKYDISNVSFISFKVNAEFKEYNIKLSTPEYNFYIVGNEINEQWVKYYFRKYLNIKLLDMFKYTIEIVDDNANFINISQDDTIKFGKDTYEINKHEPENENDFTNVEKDDNEDVNFTNVEKEFNEDDNFTNVEKEFNEDNNYVNMEKDDNENENDFTNVEKEFNEDNNYVNMEKDDNENENDYVNMEKDEN